MQVLQNTKGNASHPGTSIFYNDTDSYMTVVCRPRILGRCPWSGAGEGSATEHFHWLQSGCCLRGTGSGLAKK